MGDETHHEEIYPKGAPEQAPERKIKGIRDLTPIEIERFETSVESGREGLATWAGVGIVAASVPKLSFNAAVSHTAPLLGFPLGRFMRSVDYDPTLDRGQKIAFHTFASIGNGLVLYVSAITLGWFGVAAAGALLLAGYAAKNLSSRSKKFNLRPKLSNK